MNLLNLVPYGSHHPLLLRPRSCLSDSTAERRKHPGLLLIHEIWGLDAHIRDVADRLSREGYIVLAPDLFAGTPIQGAVDPQLFQDMLDPEKRDEAQKKMRAALAPMQAPGFGKAMQAKMRACYEHLRKEPSVSDIGVLGFCFGGTYSFATTAMIPDIKACVPFYGQPPNAERIAAIQCPVLAFYGEQDTALIETLPTLKEEMQKQGKQFEAVVYPNAGHAFFNDTNTRRYQKQAAEDAWKRTVEFLGNYLS